MGYVCRKNGFWNLEQKKRTFQAFCFQSLIKNTTVTLFFVRALKKKKEFLWPRRRVFLKSHYNVTSLDGNLFYAELEIFLDALRSSIFKYGIIFAQSNWGKKLDINFRKNKGTNVGGEMITFTQMRWTRTYYCSPKVLVQCLN